MLLLFKVELPTENIKPPLTTRQQMQICISYQSKITLWHFGGYTALLCTTENFTDSSLPGFISHMPFPSRQNMIFRPQPNEAENLISSPCKKWHCIIDQSRPLCNNINHNCISVRTSRETKWLEAVLTDIDETQQMHIIDRWEMTFIYFYLVIYSGMWKLLNIKILSNSGLIFQLWQLETCCIDRCSGFLLTNRMCQKNKYSIRLCWMWETHLQSCF